MKEPAFTIQAEGFGVLAVFLVGLFIGIAAGVML
jgi:hypothetical protein